MPLRLQPYNAAEMTVLVLAHPGSPRRRVVKRVSVHVCVLVEDIKLNSTVFHWPDSLNTVFEVNENRLENRRERAKDDLKKKIVAFEEKLAEHNKEIETFRKKEVHNGYCCMHVCCLGAVKFVTQFAIDCCYRK